MTQTKLSLFGSGTSSKADSSLASGVTRRWAQVLDVNAHVKLQSTTVDECGLPCCNHSSINARAAPSISLYHKVNERVYSQLLYGIHTNYIHEYRDTKA